MKTTGRKFTASFKAKVAIEALKEQKTLGELQTASQSHIHLEEGFFGERRQGVTPGRPDQ